MPDSSRLQRIGEVIASMDEDSDGIVKVEHVNKVIEILGRDNVQLSGKQVKQIIDLIGKEEMLEVENKIEKILGKIPVVEVRAEEKLDVAAAVKKKMAEQAESDLTEGAGAHVLEDKATELEEREMEEHIAQLFSRPETAKTDPAASKKVESLSLESSQILSRASKDNSVKDVTDSVKKEDKKEEEELEKIPQTNGSSKH